MIDVPQSAADPWPRKPGAHLAARCQRYRPRGWGQSRYGRSVLNARPGVREKTAKAVNDAIARLGYVRDQTAANLARSRNYRMAVILPETESQIIQSLAAALVEAGQAAATSRTELRLLRFPAGDPHALDGLIADWTEVFMAEGNLCGTLGRHTPGLTRGLDVTKNGPSPRRRRAPRKKLPSAPQEGKARGASPKDPDSAQPHRHRRQGHATDPRPLGPRPVGPQHRLDLRGPHDLPSARDQHLSADLDHPAQPHRLRRQPPEPRGRMGRPAATTSAS